MIRSTMALAFVLAFTVNARAETADPLKAARERIEMRAWGDALTFIQQEIAARPQSWRGYGMLGEYYQYGANRPADARAAYVKAYRLANQKELSSQEVREFQPLLETLARLEGERLAAGGSLEEIVLTDRFPHMPIVVQLLQRYAESTNWVGIYKVLAVLRGIPAANRPAADKTLQGKLYYFEAKAAEGLGDQWHALLKYEKASGAGVPQAPDDAKRLTQQLNQVAGSLHAEGKRLYDRGDYKAARGKFAQALVSVPRHLQARLTAQQAMDNCDRAVAIEEADARANTLRGQRKFSDALAVIEDSLSRIPEDPRIKVKRGTREKLHQSIRQQIGQERTASEKAENHRRTAGDRSIAEACDLASKGEYAKAAAALDRAEKLGTRANMKELREQLKAAQASYERYLKGLAHYRSGRLAEAIGALQSCYDEDEALNNPDIAKYLALAYFKHKQPDKAIRVADRFLDKQEDRELLDRAAAYHEGKLSSMDSKRRARTYLTRLKALAKTDPTVDQRLENLDHFSVKIEHLGRVLLIIGVLSFLGLGYLLRGSPEPVSSVRAPIPSQQRKTGQTRPVEVEPTAGLSANSASARREAIRKTLRNQVIQASSPQPTVSRPSRSVPSLTQTTQVVETEEGIGSAVWLWCQVMFRINFCGGLLGVFLAGGGQPPALGWGVAWLPVLIGCLRYRGGGPAECARIVLEICDSTIILRWPVILGLCICGSSLLFPALMREQYGDGGVWIMVLVGAAGLFLAARGVMD